MKCPGNIQITRNNGEIKSAIAPVIISASRSTDIPAFHSEWLISRLKKGYVSWINPFNPVKTQYVSFINARLIVFWTKNPNPLIPYLSFLDEIGLNYYFQYTLNNYEKEAFEPNLPPLLNRIETFIRLSELLGKEKVIWRFDPLLLTMQLTVPELLTRIRELGDQIITHTDKLVFSFADIHMYKKVQRNLIRETSFYDKSSINLAEFSITQKNDFATGIHEILLRWKKINPDFRVSTCAEDINLDKYQISHNKCIDDELIKRLFPTDRKLMEMFGMEGTLRSDFCEEQHHRMPNLKDAGQRKSCGCIISKDIGSYNTCNHLCVYCYANNSPEVVRTNLMKLNPGSESILPSGDRFHS
jgi:hypothetical protein